MDQIAIDLSGIQAVVIGAGAGGATAAWDLARRGISVAVFEEGDKLKPFEPSAYSAMKNLFRDFGTQAATTRDSVFPVMQGLGPGGTTVMNGAIVHPLSREIYNEWAAALPGLEQAMPWSELEKIGAELTPILRAKKNLEGLEDRFPAARRLSKWSRSVEAMPRAAPECVGSGRCLQGCPSGAKLSLDKTLLAEAAAKGCEIFTGHRIERLIWNSRKRVTGFQVSSRGLRRTVAFDGIVILAGGAVQTPLLLQRSGLDELNPLIGTGFQCHLSAGVVGLMDRPAFEHDGPPQGWQATTNDSRLKLATQLVPPELIFARIPVFGLKLRELLRHADRASCWTASVQAQARGTVERRLFSRAARIEFDPSPEDLNRLKAGVAVLCEFLLEAGAQSIFHGVNGMKPEITAREDLFSLRELKPTARDFTLGAGHLFGGAAIGTVTGFDLRFRGIDNLFIADASVFPSNTGQNPQWAIMTLARWAAENVLREIAR